MSLKFSRFSLRLHLGAYTRQQAAGYSFCNGYFSGQLRPGAIGDCQALVASLFSEALFVLRELHVLSLLELLSHLLDLGGVNGSLLGSEDGRLNEGECSFTKKLDMFVDLLGQLSEEPDERLLELVIALGRDVVVLQRLLTVESDLLGLDLAIFHIDLVADEADGDIIADAHQILVPLGHVLIGDSRGDIEHYDATLASNVVAVTQTTELLLTRGIPDVELDKALVRVERHGAHLDTNGGVVLLLELTSLVTLYEGGLANATIADEDELELSNGSSRFHVCVAVTNY